MSDANGNRWSKFYWADWRNDSGLRLCSLAARGLWMELLCLMHEGGGRLVVGKMTPTWPQVARILGLQKPSEITRLVAELEQAGLLRKDADGVYYCARMIRDFDASAKGREAAERRWSGTKPNGSPNGSPNANPNAKSTEADTDTEPPRSPPHGGGRRGRGFENGAGGRRPSRNAWCDMAAEVMADRANRDDEAPGSNIIQLGGRA